MKPRSLMVSIHILKGSAFNVICCCNGRVFRVIGNDFHLIAFRLSSINLGPSALVHSSCSDPVATVLPCVGCAVNIPINFDVVYKHEACWFDVAREVVNARIHTAISGGDSSPPSGLSELTGVQLDAITFTWLAAGDRTSVRQTTRETRRKCDWARDFVQQQWMIRILQCDRNICVNTIGLDSEGDGVQSCSRKVQFKWPFPRI